VGSDVRGLNRKGTVEEERMVYKDGVRRGGGE
jgi:hypothetical protein